MKKILIVLALVSCGASASSPDLIQLAQKKKVTLTKKEARVARIGQISSGRQMSGGILGTYPLGLGMGHAIQGRWEDDGKFFTYTQLGALGLMAVSGECVGKLFDKEDNDCGGPQEVLLLSGLVSYIGLRIWEIYDVWTAPAKQNRRYNYLRERLESMPEPMAEAPKVTFSILPIIGLDQKTGMALVMNF